jgi:hypothetical protein
VPEEEEEEVEEEEEEVVNQTLNSQLSFTQC